MGRRFSQIGVRLGWIRDLLYLSAGSVRRYGSMECRLPEGSCQVDKCGRRWRDALSGLASDTRHAIWHVESASGVQSVVLII